MTSITPRIIITALAVLALAVSAASAMPLRDHLQTSSLAGTSQLVYILPGLVLVGMLGAAVVYARPPRRSPA